MKKAGIAALVIVSILVGGVFFLSSRLEGYLNDNRDWIAEQAQSALGREVAFGKLGVSFSGGVGASIADLRLGEDAAYGDGDFVVLDEAVVRVKIWPALFGRYEVSSIELRRPRINVIVGPTGMNIDSLGGSAVAGEPGGQETAGQTDPASALAIALLDIEDGELRYVDRSGPEEVVLTIERLNVEASDISTQDPIDFDLSAVLLGADKPNFEAKGRIGPVAGTDLVPVELTLSLASLAIDDLLRLPQMVGVLPEGARASGVLDVDLSVTGNPEQLRWQMKADGTETELDLPETFVKASGVPLSVEAAGGYAGNIVDVESGTLQLARAAISTIGRVTLGDPVQYAFTVTSKDTPLSGWEASLPSLEGLGLDGRAALDLRVVDGATPEAAPAISGNVTLTEFAARIPGQPDFEGLNTTLVLRDGGLVMPEAAFRYGDSPAKLSLRIPDIMDPRVAFTMTSPGMRGESLGLNEPGAEKPDLLQGLRLVGTAVPVEAGTVVDASIESTGGVIGGVAYENMKGRIHADATLAKVEDLVVQAFGGRATVQGTYELIETDRPGWSLDLDLAGIQAAQLAASQLGFASDLFEGKLNSNINLTGKGFDHDALVQALSGKGKFDLAEGMLKNVNLGEVVLQKITGVSGLSNMLSPEVKTRHPKLFEEGNTAIRNLRSKLVVRDGRVHANDLVLQAFDFGLTGDGSIGLDGDVQFKTTFTTTPELASSLAGSKGLAKLLAGKDGRIEVPVKLAGSLSGVSVKPDLDFAQKALARAAQDGLRDGAASLINNVLGTKRTSPASPSPQTERSAQASTPPSQAEKGADTPATETGNSDPSPPSSDAETLDAPSAAPKEKPTKASKVLERGLNDLLGR